MMSARSYEHPESWVVSGPTLKHQPWALYWTEGVLDCLEGWNLSALETKLHTHANCCLLHEFATRTLLLRRQHTHTHTHTHTLYHECEYSTVGQRVHTSANIIRYCPPSIAGARHIAAFFAGLDWTAPGILPAFCRFGGRLWIPNIFHGQQVNAAWIQFQRE